MKYLLLSLWILYVSGNCYAQKVTQIEAQKAAQFAHKQMKAGMASQTKAPIVLSGEKGNDTLMYVFPYEKNGFAIISANKVAPPLLGFSKTGSFNQAEIPPGLAYFIEKYKYNLQRIIQNKTKGWRGSATRVLLAKAKSICPIGQGTNYPIGIASRQIASAEVFTNPDGLNKSITTILLVLLPNKHMLLNIHFRRSPFYLLQNNYIATQNQLLTNK